MLHEQVKYASVSISDMLKIPNLAFTRREREYLLSILTYFAIITSGR
jgi:hypothetical protein